MNVALYVRVSTEEQRLHGLSLDAQTDALKEWAKPYNIVGLYADEGVSGRIDPEKRPALQRMLRDVEEGKIDLIAFTKLDRFFRSVGAYYRVHNILEKNNVSWKAIHEDYETQTASGRLKVNIMLSVAQDEADRTSERIRTIFDNKRAKGEVVSGKVPLGLKIENKHYAPTEEFPLVKGVFQTYLNTHSKAACRSYLLEHGIERGTSTITWMLSNENYAPFLDEFDQVQNILEHHKYIHPPRTDRVYLFTGLLKCSECGSKMAPLHSKGYYYYQCNRHHRGIGCVSKCWDEKVIEQQLLSQVVDDAQKYNMEIKTGKPSQAPVIKRKMERLKELYLNELISLDEYKTDYAALQADLRADSESKQEIPVERIITLKQGYELLNKKNRSIFWKRIVDHVDVHPDGTLDVTFTF